MAEWVWRGISVRRLLNDFVQASLASEIGGTLVAASRLSAVEEALVAAVTRYHAGHPLEDGMPREEVRERLFARAPLPVFEHVLRVLTDRKRIIARDRIALAGHNVALTDDEARARDAMVETLRAAKLTPPDPSMLATQIGVPLEVVTRIATLLVRRSELVRAGDLLFHESAMKQLKSEIQSLKQSGVTDTIDVASFKDRYNITRKYAIPLLEYLDRERVTKRVGGSRAQDTLNFPLTKDLVLLGGGHSHVIVLKQLGMVPVPGVRVILVSRVAETPYSGMLPGLIAGHYTKEEAHIDLEPLARFARADAVFDEAIGLDLARKQVLFRQRPPIGYDVLSIDIGSTPNLTVAGAAEHVTPVKPIDRLLERWSALTARLSADHSTRRRVAVVGGGAGGVELILSVQHAIHTRLVPEGRGAHIEYHLFTEGDQVLLSHNASVRRRFERILAARGVRVHHGSAVVEVARGVLRTADGRTHEIDETLWTTQAAAAPWLAQSGLAVDTDGFVQVSRTLQSISHGDVFAAGDIAAMVDDPRPKSGVFAVRQGPPLARNLRRALLGEPLEEYYPQRQFLSLISTGDRYAVASRGPIAFEGAWVWRWKDWIDRRFMRQFTHLTGFRRSPGQASDRVS